MRANKFAFAFGIFAVVVGIIFDVFSLFLKLGTNDSATGILWGSIIIVVGLVFLSIDHSHIRYASLAVVGIGIFYYFLVQTHYNYITSIFVAVLIIAIIEFGLRYR
ncbi:hypothetical protein PL11_005415 [Lentilactobacillus curieae]|uniref:Uncharacterized protein n=1 Tax=Lentilactobacillus curieae TaxID=1138822 RepID=A0A1S6QII8_9LACO|nr:hypothetical protein [Lentilactobacillus curieae]AQW21409.1 hypothetical protein PL11_005415 [Lentilactobacillus curieae]